MIVPVGFSDFFRFFVQAGEPAFLVGESDSDEVDSERAVGRVFLFV
jgi:hypothetical protein